MERHLILRSVLLGLLGALFYFFSDQAIGYVRGPRYVRVGNLSCPRLLPWEQCQEWYDAEGMCCHSWIAINIPRLLGAILIFGSFVSLVYHIGLQAICSAPTQQ